jgi:anti-sigma regulatory factor (Ser/Thr protein kinase)
VIWTETFPNTPSSVTRARHLVTEVLRDVPKETRQIVEIAASEIASNCVVHTSSAFTVSISVLPACIRVDITDVGGGEPHLRSPSHLDSAGRGLRIVHLLAGRWGISRSDGPGKTVWFEVDNTDAGPGGPNGESRVETSAQEV